MIRIKSDFIKNSNDLRNFNIKMVVSDKSKIFTQPDKKHSKPVPIHEPVKEKAKRKRQLTMYKQLQEKLEEYNKKSREAFNEHRESMKKNREFMKENREFTIKMMASYTSKPSTEPDKKQSEPVQIHEPVQEKVKNKRKRQLTFSEQRHEPEIQLMIGIEKYNTKNSFKHNR